VGALVSAPMVRRRDCELCQEASPSGGLNSEAVRQIRRNNSEEGECRAVRHFGASNWEV